MKNLHLSLCAFILIPALPLSWAQAVDAGSDLERLAALIGSPQVQGPAAPPLRLDEVERIALAENPEIHLAARKLAAAQAHVPVAGALDDPQAMYRGWGVPLSKPWDYNAAQNMFMLGESLPGRGKRSLRTDIARSDVAQANAELDATRLRIRVSVRKAFIDMVRAQEEIRIHHQHVAIAQRAITAARIKYSVGKIPQVEILKAEVALTRLAEHMIRFQKDAELARVHLNTLMARSSDTPLAVQGENAMTESLPSFNSLVATAMKMRPDLMEAAAAEEKSRREQALAKRSFVPDFNVATGYMLMPPGQDPRNNYMVEASMTLPWLNRRKHEAEINEASAAVATKNAEIAAMKNEVVNQIQESLAEARAAQQLAQVYQSSLRPQAEATLHSAVIAYENDQASFLDLLDSQMTLIDVDLATIDAVADFNMKLAELEFAVGAPTTAQEIAK